MASGVRVVELVGPSAKILRAQKVLNRSQTDESIAEACSDVTITSIDQDGLPTRFFVHFTDKEVLFRVLETLTLSRGCLLIVDHLGIERGAEYL